MQSLEKIEATKACFDGLSIGIVVTTLAGLVPHLAALLSVIWAGIRIYETDTVQSRLPERWRNKKEKKQ